MNTTNRTSHILSNTTIQSVTNSPPDCHTLGLAIQIVINFTFTIIAVLGNALIIFGMWKERKTSAMSFLLINLAISDTVVALGFGTWPTFRMIWHYSQAIQTEKVMPFMHMYYFQTVNSCFLVSLLYNTGKTDGLTHTLGHF